MATLNLPYNATEIIDAITESINPLDGTLEFSRTFDVDWDNRFLFAAHMLPGVTSTAGIPETNAGQAYPGWENVVAYSYELVNGFVNDPTSGKPGISEDVLSLGLITYDRARVKIKYKSSSSGSNFTTIGQLNDLPEEDPIAAIRLEISGNANSKMFSVESGAFRDNLGKPVDWKQQLGINIGYTDWNFHFPEIAAPSLQFAIQQIGTVNKFQLSFIALNNDVGIEEVVCEKGTLRYNGFKFNSKVNIDGEFIADISHSFSHIGLLPGDLDGIVVFVNNEVFNWQTVIKKLNAEDNLKDVPNKVINQPWALTQGQIYPWAVNDFNFMLNFNQL